MTALRKYARLEASALWRPTAEAQRRDVIVSIGDATLVVSDLRDQALTHWSLAAVQRANPGVRPAIFHPDGDPGETLEISADEAEMIEAIEKLRRAVERARPRPGRLRWLGFAISVLAMAALVVFWLPGAIVDHTVGVVPQVHRGAIGEALMQRIERVGGTACADAGGLRALRKLRARLGSGPLAILPSVPVASLHLPGGHILLDRSLVEDHEEPDVVAGYVLAETRRAKTSDPLRDMLDVLGPWDSFRLLTSGEVDPGALDDYAVHLMKVAPGEVDPAPLLDAFAAARVRSTPYAYARDVSGESTLALIEADPMAGRDADALLSDADWLRLQGICGG
ncbi:hypothetical protein R5H30_12070 [Sulfitobacter sp. D35]|uniref:hypothetical protein n=1 Tax=Sulfitobacter sp. D35 TaxID=3083252 RepID=UPI00296F3B87|nr:hypothetical protein [Sulfitobacter sp. D35]MDW4498722.1 hypothetical protein [Sulfitobacter sp. D35]